MGNEISKTVDKYKLMEQQQMARKQEMEANRVEEQHREWLVKRRMGTGKGQSELENVKVEEANEDDKKEQQKPSVVQAEEEFLKPELAYEIYSALPAFHQRKLLILCKDIFEKGPSPDRWTKWKILTWAGNRWNPADTYLGKDAHVSANGLNMTLDEKCHCIRAIHAVDFPRTQMQGPQICYYEMRVLHGNSYFHFGFGTTSVMASLAEFSFTLSNHGEYCETLMNSKRLLPNRTLSLNEVAVLGCGLWKHSGERKSFFTKNGQLLGKPIALPANAPNELFPYVCFLISLDGSGCCRFEDTNFGLRPFQFKYKGNEQKLAEVMVWD